MNYEQFKKEWKYAMVYNPSKFTQTRDGEDFDSCVQEAYITYKGGDEMSPSYIEHYTVKEFCEDFYQDADLDTHPYMVKSKAIKTKHANGLISMAIKFRERMGIEKIPLMGGQEKGEK